MINFILLNLEAFTTWLVQSVESWGYAGIIFLMFLESSFFPFPSEVVMIPAGYLVQSGKMNLSMVMISGITGSLLGSLLNYYLAFKLGRVFLLKFGKYVFFKPEHLEKLELYFNKHGEISTFIGRLIIGVRQYISLPAGLAKMHLGKFCFYTGLGAGIWCAILVWIGYVAGSNKELIKEHLHTVGIATIFLAFIILIGYFIKIAKTKQK